MGWEKRGNNSFFYRKERINGKVRSIYIGRSETAFLIGKLDEIKQLEKAQARRETLSTRRENETIDDQLNELSEINQILIDALLLASGFHKHKRQWRKKQDGNDKT